MFLTGQLPYGPDSLNVGGQGGSDPALVSNLEVGTFVIPESEGGGADLISPTLAMQNGVVPTPFLNTIGQYSPLALGGSGSYGGPTGDYAVDGSLVTLRNRAGRGMGLESSIDRRNVGCVPGDPLAAAGLQVASGAAAESNSPFSANWLLWLALAGVVVCLDDAGKRKKGAPKKR